MPVKKWLEHDSQTAGRSFARRPRQRGNAMIEAGFVLIPLFALIFGIVDVSMSVFVRTILQSAVREGVRYGVTYQVQGGLAHDASIAAVVRSSAVGFLFNTQVATPGEADPSPLPNRGFLSVRYYNPRSGMDTQVTGPNSNNSANLIEVCVRGYQWGWIAPMLQAGTGTTIQVCAADKMEGLPAGTAPPAR